MHKKHYIDDDEWNDYLEFVSKFKFRELSLDIKV